MIFGLVCILIAGSLGTGCVPVTPDHQEETVPPSPVSEDAPPDYTGLLERAVAHLNEAESYALHTTSVRAYESRHNGDERTVYGEFIEDIRVCFDPYRVENKSKYRFDPDESLIPETIYYFQKGDRYHQRIVESDGGGTSATVSRDEAFPYSSDILKTLSEYYPAAMFVEERDNTAQYELKQPEWYRIRSAVMFADLGMLYMQEDAESAIEAYAREHYPEAAPIVFTIDVDVDSGYIRRVTMDDADFMLSIWEAVGDAAMREGADPQELPVYTVLPENGTTYIFSDWNAVDQIDLPE